MDVLAVAFLSCPKDAANSSLFLMSARFVLRRRLFNLNWATFAAALGEATVPDANMAILTLAARVG